MEVDDAVVVEYGTRQRAEMQNASHSQHGE
jgi:hypothetical protein